MKCKLKTTCEINLEWEGAERLFLHVQFPLQTKVLVQCIPKGGFSQPSVQFPPEFGQMFLKWQLLVGLASSNLFN